MDKRLVSVMLITFLQLAIAIVFGFWLGTLHLTFGKIVLYAVLFNLPVGVAAQLARDKVMNL